ncbi:dixin isoform X2 [Microcaecilia unicolor]|uniref:Dixin n=1 Tax=Microcaecilia unicolor TaxID=1415580 RepID=A0A6P7ZC23_9AMPH|nr:dixin isoform X2 [Microcaecilia unicolor]
MMLACLDRGNVLEILQEGFPEQLQAYVAWVNSQLKKKTGMRPVQDLRQDLRDGVALAHLVDIVAGEKLNGIQISPTSQQEMRENVQKVLEFVASKKIRMHQTSAKDIVEGNLKSIMRLILALAAHFKPSTGKTTNRSPAGKKETMSSSNHRPRSATAVAQGAVTVLADVRQDVSRSGRDVFRYRQRTSSLDEEIEKPYWSVRAMVQQYEGHQGTPSASESSSLTSSSPVHSAKSESFATPLEEKVDFEVTQSEEAENKAEETNSAPLPDWQTGQALYLETSWEEHLLEQQDYLEKEMEEARKMISGLQALLLNGSLPEDEQISFAQCEEGACPEEQLVIIKSRLDQSMEENQDIKKELLRYKQEARNLQGIKDALQQRMAQQENSILQLKQELLRANMDKDELHSQNVDLQRKIEERNHLLGEYKKELGQKDRLLQQHQVKLEEVLRKASEGSQLKVDLERELEQKSALLRQLLNRNEDEQVSGGYNCYATQSNGFLKPGGKSAAFGSVTQRGSNDLQVVRDALRSLRNSFSGHDPQHHTLDSLELAISSLMEKLHTIETQRRQERKVRGRMPGNRATSEYRDSWPPNSKLPHSHSTPTMSSSTCTKVLYFTDRSLTPFMVNIPKRLGEVTLSDFKAATSREGNHRYHFKALDPEFGTVKEEVFNDDEIIPGWEGKIVAWVEEDHGDS